MIQKLVLPVDTTNGTRFKEGDLIVYDEKNQYFYKTTKENLFAKEQQERKEFVDNINKTVQNMANQYDCFVSNINRIIQNMQTNYNLEVAKSNQNINSKIQEVDNYMKNMTKQYNEFLEEFKETNTKLIEMVEKVIV